MARNARVRLRRDCSKLRKFPLVSLEGLKLSSTEGTGEGARCREGLSATTRTSAEDAAGDGNLARKAGDGDWGAGDGDPGNVCGMPQTLHFTVGATIEGS